MALLGNQMPELTDQELSFLGNDTVSYFDTKANCHVTARGSFELFAHHAGLTGVEKEKAKTRAYACGRLTVEGTHGEVVFISMSTHR